jgi:putative endonuclease
MGNDRPTRYTGVTNNLVRRVHEHRNELASGFTSKYHLHKLLYFESYDTIQAAIIREKQINDLNRKDKLDLIRKVNSEFRDLYPLILESLRSPE